MTGYGFPLIFGMDDTSTATGCTDDISLSAFTISQGDTGNQMILAGRVSPASASSCPVLTNSANAVTNFITSFSSIGTFKWYKLIPSSSYSFTSAVSTPSNALTAFASSSDVRVLSFALSDGSLSTEKVLRDSAGAMSSISDLKLSRLGQSTISYFMTMAYTESSSQKSLLMKITDSLSVTWTRILSKQSSQVFYRFFDLTALSADSSTLAALSFIKVQSSYQWPIDYNLTITKIAGSSGSSVGEVTSYYERPDMSVIGLPTVFQGAICSDYSYVYGAVVVSPSPYTVPTGLTNSLAVFSNQLASFSSFSSVKLFNQRLYSPSLMQMNSDYIALSAYSDQNNMHLFIMSRLMNVIKEQRMLKGLSGSATGYFLRSALKASGSDGFFAFQVSKYLSDNYSSRIVFHRMTNFGAGTIPDALGFECVRNATTLLSFSVLSNFTGSTFFLNSQDSTPIFSLGAPDGSTYVGFASSVASVSSSLSLKTDSELQEGAFWAKPDDYQSLSVSTAKQSLLSSGLQRCNGNPYTITSIQYNNGSDFAQPYYYNAASSSLLVKFDEVDFNPESFVGSQTWTVTATTEGGSVTVKQQVRVKVEPPSSLAVANISLYSVDPQVCARVSTIQSPLPQSTALYPFFYGDQERDVVFNHFEMTTSGIMAIAGNAQAPPFAPVIDPSTGVHKGFLAYVDQLAKPLWIYYVDVDTTQTGAALSTDCSYITEYTEEWVKPTYTPVIDKYGITIEYTVTKEYSYFTYAYGLCHAFDAAHSITRTALVKLDPASAKLITMRFMPRDAYDDVNNQGLFVGGITNSDLILVQRFNTAVYSNLAAMRVSYYQEPQSTSYIYQPVWYHKFKDGTRTQTQDPIDVLMVLDQPLPYDLTEDYLYTFRRMAAAGVRVSLIRLSDGQAMATTVVSSSRSDADSSCNQMVNPLNGHITFTTNSQSTFVYSLWELSNATLAKVFAKDFATANSYNFMSANVAIVSSKYRMVLTSWNCFAVATLSTDRTTIESWKVWEYYSASSHPTFSLVGKTVFLAGSTTAKDALFFAASGHAELTNAVSSVIFRYPMDASADSLSGVTFRDARASETQYVMGYTSSSEALTVSDVSADAVFTQSVMYRYTDFLTQANGVNLRTLSFETSGPNNRANWGLKPFPKQNDHLYPQEIRNYKVGAYVGQNVHAGFASVLVNGESVTVGANQIANYFEITLGDVIQIQLNSPAATCQGRKQNLRVFSASNPDKQISYSYAHYQEGSQTLILDTRGSLTLEQLSAEQTGRRRVLLGEETDLPQAGTYAFVARYEDEFDGASNYFDHLLTIRVLPNWEVQASEFDEGKCFQNVYPYSFGGCDGTNCGMTVDATVYDSGSLSRIIYMGGSAQAGNVFLGSQLQTGSSGYLMVVNTVGIPQWFSVLSLSLASYNKVTAIAKNGDYLYCNLLAAGDPSDYPDFTQALVQVSAVSGIIRSSQSINTNAPTYGFVSLHYVQDLQVVPYLKTHPTLALGAILQTQGSNNQQSGTIWVQDNGDNTYTALGGRIFPSIALETFQVGSQLFNSQDSTSLVSYESFLNQKNTVAPYVYLAKLSNNVVQWAKSIQLVGGSNDPTGMVTSPQMALDYASAANGGGDVYLVTYTLAAQYLIHYDLSANSFSSYTIALTGLTNLQAFEIQTFTNSGSTLIVISHIKQAGPDQTQYFMTLKASDLSVVSYIRRDSFTAVGHGKLILSSPSDAFFLTVRQTVGFSFSNTQPHVLVDKRSLTFTMDNEFSCQPNNIYDASKLTLAGVSLTIASIDFTLTAFTLADFGLQVSFMVTPYLSSQVMSSQELRAKNYEAGTYGNFKLYPQSMAATNAYYEDGQGASCHQASGIQAPFNQVPILIDVTRDGSALNYTFNTSDSDQFTQCQGLGVEFASLYFETGSTEMPAASALFMNFTNQTLMVDASSVDKPAAGARVMRLELQTQQVGYVEGEQDLKVSEVPLILQVKPETKQVSALKYKKRSYNCNGVLEYPKVLAGPTDGSDILVYASDLDESNGNIVIGGQLGANYMINQDFYQASVDRGYVMMMDIAGYIYWTYTVTFLPEGGDIRVLDTKIGRNQYYYDDNIYVLIESDDGNSNIVDALAMMSYDFGTLRQVRRLPGQSSSLRRKIALQWVNNELYFAYHGLRKDLDLTYGNQFALFKRDSEGNMFQLWNSRVQFSSGSVTNRPRVSALAFLPSGDLVAASYVQEDSLGKFVNLAKYDSLSGSRLAQISFSVGTLQYQNVIFPMVVDQTNNLVFLAFDIFSGSQHTAILKSFDFNLAVVDGVQVTVGSTTDVFIADLAQDSTHIYQQLYTGENKIHVLKFLKSDLTLVTASIFTVPDTLSEQQLYIHAFSNTLTVSGVKTTTPIVMTVFSNVGFVSNKREVVLNKLDADLENANPCLTTPTVIFQSGASLTSAVNSAAGITGSTSINALLTVVSTPSHYKLQHFFNAYFENKFYSAGEVLLQPASTLGCKPQFSSFPVGALSPKTVYLPQVGRQTIEGVQLPSVCDRESMQVKLTMDKYTQFPQFIVDGGLARGVSDWDDEYYQRIVFNNLTVAEAGVYLFKLDVSYHSIQLSDYQLVQVRAPAANLTFGLDIASQACAADSVPSQFMSYGGIYGNIYAAIDISTTAIVVPKVDGSTTTITGSYLLCGANADWNNPFKQSTYQSFVQLLTVGHAVRWHKTVSAGASHNVAVACYFSFTTLDAAATPQKVQSYEDRVFLVINSKSTIDTTVNDTIYFVTLSSADGSFVSSRMMRNKNGLRLEAHGSLLVKGGDDNGDLYLNGVADGSILANQEPSLFVMRLTRDFGLVFYSYFDFGSSPVGGMMLLGSSSLYQVFGYSAVASGQQVYRWGLTALSKSLGTVLSSNQAIVTLANGVIINRDPGRSMYHQAVHLRTPYLYSCLIYTLEQDEVAITRHSATDLLPAHAFDSVELNRGRLVFDSCDLLSRSALSPVDSSPITELVVALGSEQQTFIFALDVTDATVKMSNLTLKSLLFAHPTFNPINLMLTLLGDTFTLFIRTVNYYQSNEERMFSLKFSNLETPAWKDNACSYDYASGDSQYNLHLTTLSSFYPSLRLADHGLDGSQISSWAAMVINTNFQVHQVTSADFVSAGYLLNAASFGMQTVGFPDNIYRSDFLSCSRYTVPTAPASVTLSASDKTTFSQGFLVRSKPYLVPLAEFTTCSFDPLLLEIVDANGKGTVPEGLFEIDQATRVLKIQANDNKYEGSYKLRYQASPDGNRDFASFVKFNLVVERNQPPQMKIDKNFTLTKVVSTYHSYTWSYTLDYNEPTDNETIFTAVLFDGDGYPLTDLSWFSVRGQNTTQVEVSVRNPPTSSRSASTVDSYFLNILLSDEFNSDDHAMVYVVELQIINNQIPVLSPTLKLDLGEYYVGKLFDFSLDPNSDFEDPEGDLPVVVCSVHSSMKTNSAGQLLWLTQTIDSTTGVIKYTGTKPTNEELPSTILFLCSVTDFSVVSVKTYPFSVDVLPNLPPILSVPAEQSVSLTKVSYHKFGELAYGCIDPEGQELSKTLFINGQTWDQSLLAGPAQIFAFDADSFELSINFNSVAQIGEYEITVVCDDSFNPAIQFTITLSNVDNHPPTQSNPIPFRWGVQAFSDEYYYPLKEFIIDITNVFVDVDAQDSELQLELRGENDADLTTQTAVKYQIQRMSAFQTLLYLFLSSTGAPITYKLELKAYDSVMNSVNAPFQVQVKACDSSCLKCDDAGPSHCTECRPGKVIQAQHCLDSCQAGFYPNADGLSCTACPAECSECTGPDPVSQCSACQGLGFLYTDVPLSKTGCIKTCPVHFKKNYATHECTAASSTNYLSCLDLVANFAVTHSSEEFVDDYELLTKATASCTNVSPCDGEGEWDSGTGVCSWSRVLHMWCEEVDDASTTGDRTLVGEKTATMLRVTTNSMPTHCIAPIDSFPTSNVIEFEVEYNRAASLITKTDTSTYAKVTALKCAEDSFTPLLQTSLQSVYNFNLLRGIVKGIVGVSITGVPIHQGVSSSNYDAFFPKAYKANSNPIAVVEVDGCLGGNSDGDSSSFYRYYSVSPCFYTTSSVAALHHPVYCEELGICKENPPTYAKYNVPISMRKQTVVGVALDGHPILGPFSDSGMVWQPCEVDACNGVTLSTGYAYVSTMFFPYTVGCWGPASTGNTIGSVCSSNNQVCFPSSDTSSAFNLLSTSVLALLLLMLLYTLM